MKIDEHRGWLCAVITRGLVQVDLDMPSLVSRWNSCVFNGDTIVDLYAAEVKLRGKRYEGTKKDSRQ
jgi:hypothetical protein